MELKRLGDIIKITSGGTPLTSKREYYDDGNIPWAKTGDLKVRHLSKIPDSISQLGLNNSSAKIFPVNTVLIAMYGATIGNCSILKTSAATNQACAAFLPNEEVNEEFLFFFLSSIKSELIKKGVGGGQPNISATILKDIKIPLPPLSDQIRIAEILAQGENLITQRQESIIFLDELLKSTFLEMFGDPVRNEKDWTNKSLDTLIDKKRGISYGIVQRGREENIGIPVVRIRDVESAKYRIDEFVKTTKQISDKYKRTILEGGEILISIRGTVGKLSIAPHYAKGWNISREVAIIPTIGQTNKLFLLHLLKSFPIQQKIAADIKGVAQSGINLSDLRNLKIILPHESLQIEFATIVEKVEVLKSEYQASLKELENMYGVLSQKAFKGELNLKKLNK
nr:restriction endonuclease subunit S [uncultured Flavobacterium sp.]